ncbi:hypothetical protein JCM10296v2_001920 [Rhodotorula toruloides]
MIDLVSPFLSPSQRARLCKSFIPLAQRYAQEKSDVTEQLLEDTLIDSTTRAELVNALCGAGSLELMTNEHAQQVYQAALDQLEASHLSNLLTDIKTNLVALSTHKDAYLLVKRAVGRFKANITPSIYKKAEAVWRDEWGRLVLQSIAQEDVLRPSLLPSIFQLTPRHAHDANGTYAAFRYLEQAATANQLGEIEAYVIGLLERPEEELEKVVEGYHGCRLMIELLDLLEKQRSTYASTFADSLRKLFRQIKALNSTAHAFLWDYLAGERDFRAPLPPQDQPAAGRRPGPPAKRGRRPALAAAEGSVELAQDGAAQGLKPSKYGTSKWDPVWQPPERDSGWSTIPRPIATETSPTPAQQEIEPPPVKPAVYARSRWNPGWEPPTSDRGWDKGPRPQRTDGRSGIRVGTADDERQRMGGEGEGPDSQGGTEP